MNMPHRLLIQSTVGFQSPTFLDKIWQGNYHSLMMNSVTPTHYKRQGLGGGYFGVYALWLLFQMMYWLDILRLFCNTISVIWHLLAKKL